MAIMQRGECLVRWIFDNATKILSTAKAFDKTLLTERNVKSKCKYISDLKTKPRKEKKRAERLANAELTFSFAQRRADDPKITSEASGETLKSPKIEILATL